MRLSLRRTRAVVISGAIWASIGGVASAAYTLVAAVLNGTSLSLNDLTNVITGWVFFGFITGSLFAVFLGWLQRGRELTRLSMIRSALAGFIGGALFGALLVALDGAFRHFDLITLVGQSSITGVMGMLAGFGMVSIAKRSHWIYNLRMQR